ncbi:actin-related protein Arp6 [Mycena floridula]|nr:actin-related protein Arp6 [Mycena floridula]
MPTIILDNGAATIKAGVLNEGEDVLPRLIPNAIVRSKGDKKTYFGHEIERCKDYASLNYRLPLEKGYIVDWDAQKAVWDGIFSEEVFGIDTTEATLLLTEPYFNLPKIQTICDQFVFEEYEFSSYYRCTPASLIPHGDLFATPDLPPAECMLIVESGFSFTHVIPILEGNVVWSAVKRLDVGGKLLTNQLKELISFRQWNMMDETYIMNEVKEECCFVSTDFKGDLETCRVDLKSNPIVQRYLLPDMSSNRRGRLLIGDDEPAADQQVLLMNNERFVVPEIIFRPDDIGMNQSGLAETITTSISLLPFDLQDMFWSNIGLIGGNTKFPGFQQRLMAELRSLAPVTTEVVIFTPPDPIIEVYNSATSFASTEAFAARTLSRTEYAENGSHYKNFREGKFRDADRDKDPEPVPSKGKGKLREESRSQASIGWAKRAI